MRLRSSLLALSLLTASGLATAADVTKYDGFLCCNLRTDGSWISDSNYAEDGKRVLAVGTGQRHRLWPQPRQHQGRRREAVHR